MSKCKTLMAACLKGRGMQASMSRFMRQYADAMTIEFADLRPNVAYTTCEQKLLLLTSLRQLPDFRNAQGSL